MDGDEINKALRTPDAALPDEEIESLPQLARRQLIHTAANPNRKLEYLSTLKLAIDGLGVEVTITYVPDKLLIEAEAFTSYLASFASTAISSLEELALEILDDINNEVVPYWVQVRLERETGPNGPAQSVVAEDNQPRWNNDSLLARLR